MIENFPGEILHTISENTGRKIPDFNKGIGVFGILLFIIGLFIPSIQINSFGAPVPLFEVNPQFVAIYIILAFVALVFIVTDHQIVTALIGTTLGLYLILAGVPAAFQGLLTIGFIFTVFGDLLLIFVCMYSDKVQPSENYTR